MKLETNEFGNTGLQVTRLGYGAMELREGPEDLANDLLNLVLDSGINFIDTSIDYGDSEKLIGKFISHRRSEFFLASKCGCPIGAGGDHIFTKENITNGINQSLKLLKTDYLDLVQLHNPIKNVVEENDVIQTLLEIKKEGKIRFYGLATWECFRATSDNAMFLSLEDVVKLAQDVGGSDHGFRFIQLPFNLHFDQAMLLKNQTVSGTQKSILDSANELGIGVFTSVPLMQGKLLEWAKSKPLFTSSSPSVGLLQFIRSTPGVLAPLIGQKSSTHVNENLEVMKINSLNQSEYDEFLKKLVS